MPTLIGLSRTAMRYDRTSAACVAFAEALPSVSHDRLPSLLPADGSGHPRLARACRTRVVVAQGDLRSDDPVIAPPCATALEGGAWVDASQEQRAVYGRSVVRLI